MLRTTLTLILILLGCLTFGQVYKLNEKSKIESKLEPKILDSLYVIALNNRFDLFSQSGLHYLEMNEYVSRIKNLSVSDKYKFLTHDELFKLSIKEKRRIKLIRVGHRIISKDTVDINFGNIGFKGRRKLHFHHGIHFRMVEIDVGCGGTNGYQPDIRFICDSRTKQWKIVRNRFIENGEGK